MRWDQIASAIVRISMWATSAVVPMNSLTS